MSIKLEKKSESVHFNSVQLNIVTFVDVRKANANQTLNGNVYMMDNSPDSLWQGTASLQTTCKQGQVLNWIIYAMDMERRADGSWPPSVRINNIVFLNENGNDVIDIKVCTDLKIYGAPDEIRSTMTPVYYYWAGTVLGNLLPGIYKYRLILELETENASKKNYMNLDTPSLNVISVNPNTVSSGV